MTSRNLLFFFVLFTLIVSCQQKQEVYIELKGNAQAAYGIESLRDVLAESDLSLINEPKDGARKIMIDLKEPDASSDPEGFEIKSAGDSIVVLGNGKNGLLYGCLELGEQIKKSGGWIGEMDFSDQPDMKLRGTCIGLQKTEYLPGRTVYEYPYTPENFPWFYDKDLWIKYLDMMAENRYNALFLWNGHPFASLVKLDDYPYALEVDEETYRKNEEMFTFLTTEAEKRGIWVIQMFYNIIVSKPFAEHHGIKTQDRSRPIIPFIADYTRKSIAAFVEKYPNVGLLVALGEAMQGIDNDVAWFTETVIPGVQDGLKALGKTEQPPIVLRGHDTDAVVVMENALPLYQNLYTLNKYNGESLTTYEPKGKWAAYHKSLSELGSTHIDNVHILANLEPFRYWSPDFIQRSVQAMHTTHGANGLHLYPQTSYWEWPYAPDNVSPKLLEMERDSLWYKAWARYAWRANRSRVEEDEYWSGLLNKGFGCTDCGEKILDAFEYSGEISPMILRRFGITEGNRQTMTLGMFMSQLISPEKFSLNRMLNESHSPQGEWLAEYVKKEVESQEHQGETPAWAADKILEYAEKARQAIESVTGVSRAEDEFLRMKNDIYCYEAMAKFYSDKVKSALSVLRYGYTQDIEDLEKAITLLESSVGHFEVLTDLTKDYYLYANSMQTQQRRIPIGGNDGRNKTWEELLPYYETELENFKRNISLLKNTNGEKVKVEVEALEPVSVDFIGQNHGRFDLTVGSRPFTEQDYVIEGVAKEISKLKGVKYSFEELDDNDTEVKFSNDVPVKMVVGFFQSDKTEFLSPPTLEFDASANFYGQADIKILNALKISGLPPVNVHTYYFEPGTHSLLFDNDVFLLLGFIDGGTSIKPRDAGFANEGVASGLDWLFY